MSARARHPFAILAPDLTRQESKILQAMLQKVGLHPDGAPELVDQLPNLHQHVLSVGKAALDIWHHYGLVQVGAHHGTMFTHRDPRGFRYEVMVLQHPGTALQRTLPGFEAKQQMVVDLERWRLVLEGRVSADRLRMEGCARCLATRVKAGFTPPRRRAEFWVEELDAVGLCDDHWRTRGRIVRKDRVKVERNKSKREAQIAGQGEMIADGQHIMVSKR